jgi:hypothetical protein
MDDPLINAMTIISVLGMIIVIIVIVGGARAEARRRKDLDLHGRTVTATITSVSGDGINEYYVTAEWMNPQTGAISTFTGRSSEHRIGASVEVVFDSRNPRNCYFPR